MFNPTFHAFVDMVYIINQYLLFIFRINDVVATSDDHFYVTNWFYSRSHWGRRLERHLGFAWGQIVHFDGVRGHQMAAGLSKPAGINMSPDGKYVCVCVRVYVRVCV